MLERLGWRRLAGMALWAGGGDDEAATPCDVRTGADLAGSTRDRYAVWCATA